MFEALQRLRFEAFLESMNEDERTNALKTVDQIKNAYAEGTLMSLTQSLEICDLHQRYLNFVTERSNSHGTFEYWSQYIEMVQVLLLLVRATRTSNWELHLCAVRAMLPWFFIADRIDYARYASVYWVEMCSLPKSHPGKYPSVCSSYNYAKFI